MSADNPCRALQRPFPYSKPPSPPLLFVKDADVVISLLPGEQHNLYLRSDMLRQTSSFFRGALSEEWIHNKVTGQEDIGNGTFRTIKKFELEFFEDGSNMLVGKTSITPCQQRTAILESNITSTSYKPAARKLRDTCMGVSVFDRPFEEVAQSTLERDFVATTNFIGLAILCGFPPDPNILTNLLSAKSGGRLRQSHRVIYLIQMLIRWIDFYGTLEAVRWRFLHVIMNLTHGRLMKEPIAYLRIASAMCNEDFSKWVLNKIPMFIEYQCLSLSSLDNRLGLSHWTHIFGRHLVEISVMEQWVLKRPFHHDWRRGLTCEVSHEAVRIWRIWIHEIVHDIQPDGDNRARAIAFEVLFHYDNCSENTCSFYSYYQESGFGSELKMSKELDTALHKLLDYATGLILEDYTPNPCKGMKIRQNNYLFFCRYGFPWHFREETDSDGSLLSMIATTDLNEDTRGYHTPWISEPVNTNIRDL